MMLDFCLFNCHLQPFLQANISKLTAYCMHHLLSDISKKYKYLLMVLVSRVILGFGPHQDPWPYLCSLQSHLRVLKYSLLLDEKRIRLSVTTANKAVICRWPWPNTHACLSRIALPCSCDSQKISSHCYPKFIAQLVFTMKMK
jgi:hypothetical protein